MTYQSIIYNSLPAAQKNPDVLGPNFKTLMNFWIWLEKNYRQDLSVDYDNTHASNVRETVEKFIGFSNQLEIWNYTRVLFQENYIIGNCAAWAALEILVMDKLLEENKELFYLKALVKAVDG